MSAANGMVVSPWANRYTTAVDEPAMRSSRVCEEVVEQRAGVVDGVGLPLHAGAVLVEGLGVGGVAERLAVSCGTYRAKVMSVSFAMPGAVE